MTSALRTSDAGLQLIKAYEGFRSYSSRLPDRRWVIGYGHVRAARAGLQVSESEAEAILREYDLPPIEQGILDLVLVPLNQNEFDALVSLTFNIGLDQFRTSDVLERLNFSDRMGAARAIERWRKARVGNRSMVVDPLVRRRADEKALFLKAVGFVPRAESSRYRPLVDNGPEEPAVGSGSFVVSEESDGGADSKSTNGEESAPEAAARNVKERLTRILGEEEDGWDAQADPFAAVDASSPDPDGEDEVESDASIEEIRAAVSALVSEDDEEDGERTRPSPVSDMDPLNETEDEPITSNKLRVNDSEAVDKDALAVDTEDEFAVRTSNTDRKRDRSREGPLEVFLLALIALAGAGLFGFGGVMEYGWLQLEMPAAEGAPAYLAPVLMLVGGLVFLIMSYYVLKALFRRG